MAEQGIKIVERDGMFYLSGVLNEYADFSELHNQPPPLRLHLREVRRLNSIGIRNLLKFLSNWGLRAFEFYEVPSEFVDQVNMIPALLGVRGHGLIKSLFVPYECQQCDHDEDVLSQIEEFASIQVSSNAEPPTRACSRCGGKMTLLHDTFFTFLQHPS